MIAIDWILSLYAGIGAGLSIVAAVITKDRNPLTYFILFFLWLPLLGVMLLVTPVFVNDDSA